MAIEARVHLFEGPNVKQHRSLIAAALLLGITATAAPALAAGPYVGASVGRSDADVSAADLGFSPGSTDKTDTGWHVFAGYQFNANFALEASYVELGEVTTSGTFDGVPGITQVDDSTGFDVAAVGLLPLGANVSLFGKAGIYWLNTEARITGGGVSAAANDNNVDWKVGLGLKYDITRNFSVRAEWERYVDVAKNVTLDSTTGLETGKGYDVDLWTIGVAYHF